MTRVDLVTLDKIPSLIPAAVMAVSNESDSPVRFTKGITPPASPGINDLWLSTSVADMRIAPGAADRVRLLQATQAWEQNAVQEPTVWFDGQWNMLYTGGWTLPGLGWATCPATSNPLDPASWTKYAGNPIIGQGGLGWAGNVAHSSAYYEAGTLYIYFPNVGAGSDLYVAHGIDPLHLTLEAAAVSTDTPKKWNSRVFKRGTNDYVMFFTASVNTPTLKWNAGYATSTSLLGTWTTDTYPIPSLDPVTGAGGTDGPVITLENGVYVGWYHSASINQVSPTDIWRATSTDLRNWTILDNKQPVIKRTASYEVDQVADVFLVTTPSGFKFAVWDALDNTVPTSSISAAPLSPVLKRFDGAHWQPVLADSGSAYQTGIGANEHFGMGTLSHVTPDFANTLGLGNTAVGSRAMAFLTTGTYNTAVGAAALQVSTTGIKNTAVGNQALNATTTGGSNTGLGYFALLLNTTGSNNTAVGTSALQANTTGGSNVAVGMNTLFANTTGVTNTAVGYQALLANTTAALNTAIGSGALQANTTGASNTAVGGSALVANTTGGSNVAVGVSALQANTTAAQNTAIGVNALKVNTTGANNVAAGQNALVANITGANNAAVGQAALSNVTASNNTGIGFQAGLQFSSGASNSALGSAAGNTDGTTATDGTLSGMTLLGEKSQSLLPDVLVLGKAAGGTRPNLFYGVVPSTALISTGTAAHFGRGVFFMGTALTNPSANPVGGGILYPDGAFSSQLKWRDPNGITSVLSYLSNGTTTLVAGTKAIADTNITANAIVLVYSISSGGTVGALSVVLNAGVGFTINSTSGTDTSKVFYRVVSY